MKNTDRLKRTNTTNHKDISAVFAIVTTTDNRLIIADTPRGVDLPGGHVEPSDTTPRDALIREVAEEIGVSIHNIRPFAVFTTKGGKYDGKKMLYFTAKTYLSCINNRHKESFLVMPIGDFLDEYDYDINLMYKVVKLAYERDR